MLKNFHTRRLIIEVYTQINKLKNDKNLLQNKLEKSTNKESLIDKETMTDLIEIKKSSEVKTETLENGTNK